MIPVAYRFLPILGLVVGWVLPAMIVPVRLEPVGFPPFRRSARRGPGFRLQPSGLAVRIVLPSSPPGVVGGPHIVDLSVLAP